MKGPPRFTDKTDNKMKKNHPAGPLSTVYDAYTGPPGATLNATRDPGDGG